MRLIRVAANKQASWMQIILQMQLACYSYLSAQDKHHDIKMKWAMKDIIGNVIKVRRRKMISKSLT